MLNTCSALVFREIQSDNDKCFQWFRLGDQQKNEDLIVPLDIIYSEEEHWLRFTERFT